ncbi:MAG TPA: hypothetical protein VK879_00665 [Candidatus Sulfomarinibacteraceae bacterium]|nr:hypothetical protein [Candidatus Sulfomarinibacteraceae bacterium]
MFLGRQLFWLFVAAAGFVTGFNLAGRFLGDVAGWLLLLVGLLVGVFGALLAVFAQRLAVAIGGFFAGGYILLYVSGLLGVADEGSLATVLFIVGGIVGAVLISLLLDPALIFLSSALGAALLSDVITGSVEMARVGDSLLFLILLVVGIAVQWTAWHRGERARPVGRHE